MKKTIFIPLLLLLAALLAADPNYYPLTTIAESCVTENSPDCVSALANLANEAALLAARLNRKKVTMSDMENSIERVIAGPEKKSKVISEKEKWPFKSAAAYSDADLFRRIFR